VVAFQTPLKVEYINGRRWRVLEDFTYGGITVPAGFETDFASIPRVLWSIYPPAGKWGKAAVIHDYLYFTGMMPRAAADQVFLDAMEDLGVPKLRRRVMYRAVRLGGGGAWNRHRNEQRVRLLALQEKARRKEIRP
jgi:hypothetical protein